MKTIKKFATLFFVLCISIFFFSCGNNLSRGEAKGLIVKKFNLPQIQSIDINKRYYKTERYVVYHGGLPTANIIIGRIDYSDYQTMLTNLSAQGLITIGETVEKDYNANADYVYAVVSLTDEGKKYLISESSDKFVVKTCEIDFGEITGIQKQEQFKIAEVHYTLIRKNITPFGINISQQPEDRTQSFSLFDDGWRIQ